MLSKLDWSFICTHIFDPYALLSGFPQQKYMNLIMHPSALSHALSIFKDCMCSCCSVATSKYSTVIFTVSPAAVLVDLYSICTGYAMQGQHRGEHAERVMEDKRERSQLGRLIKHSFKTYIYLSFFKGRLVWMWISLKSRKVRPRP